MAKSPLPFNYDTDAVLEARAAYRWYADQNPSTARRFIDELERARRLVTQNPDTWALIFAEPAVSDCVDFLTA